MIYRKVGKRLLDILVSGIAILCLSPVYLILALLVRINLGSPILFKQERPGLNEKIFGMYKFRSMTDKRDESGELLPDEVRLTSFGKKLRATSLDELPELFNIFLGDMSLVGPRPLLVRYLPRYNKYQRHRHDVKPGLTGLAQVNGRNAISWEDKFKYDVEYASNITLWGDIKIIVNTFLKVVKKDGISSSTHATMEEFMGSKAVVFDLDDTLAPEILFVKSGYKAVAKKIASFEECTKKDEDEIFAMLIEEFDKDHKNVFNRVLLRCGLPEDKDIISSFVKIYREHEIYKDIYRLYDDVENTITTLDQKGVMLAVLSDGFSISQHNKAKALGLDTRFKLIVFTEDLKMDGDNSKDYMKPSPRGFDKICDELLIEPSQIIYVGDNPKKDFAIKKYRPIRTARIVRQMGVYSDAEYLDDIKEDYRLNTLTDIIKYVEGE